MSKIKIGAQVTAKVRPTKVTVSGTFQGYRLEDQEDPTSICGTVLHVKDGMQHLDYVYVDSIKVCESKDERIRKRIRLCLDECVHSDIICDYERDDCLAYLEKQKEQKPAEINEYEIIKKHITGDALSGEVNKRLKECGWYVTDDKPAEWSEEDDLMRDAILKTLERVGDYGTIGMQKDWLKSLCPQPHWKPSKEQMEALEYAIEGKFDAIKPTSYLSRRLEELEEALKRMM